MRTADHRFLPERVLKLLEDDSVEVPPSQDPKWRIGCGSFLIGCGMLCGLCTAFVGPQYVPFTAEVASPSALQEEFLSFSIVAFLILAIPGLIMILRTPRP